MRITFLGTGTSQGIPVIGCDCKVCQSSDPRDKRFRSSIYLESNAGKKILIDTSPDLRSQLLANGIKEIDVILYTHEHNDHTAGLDDVRPVNFRMQKTIPAFGLKRVTDEIRKRFHYAFDDQPYPGSPQIQLDEINKDSRLFNEICCIEIQHGSIEILGFRINDFAYLTDIKYIEASELEKLKNLKAVVISALQQMSHHSHQSFNEAITLAKKINAEKTYFTHMSHKLGLTEEFTKLMPENIFAAYDGLKITI